MVLWGWAVGGTKSGRVACLSRGQRGQKEGGLGQREDKRREFQGWGPGSKGTWEVLLFPDILLWYLKYLRRGAQWIYLFGGAESSA